MKRYRGSGRFWEVDAARGIAFLMMAVYHTAYDLYAFGGYDIDAVSGAWARFADLTAGSFLFIVGVSLAIAHGREAGSVAGSGGPGFRKYLFRGLKVFGFGMLLTVAFYAFGMGYVVFGILHLIGVSIILAYPFLRLRALNLALGLVVFAVGLYTMGLDWQPEGLAAVVGLPLGFAPENFPMPDYRPLLPWFGVVLAGVGAGSLVYGGGRRLVQRPAPPLLRPLLFSGRHSLFFYLVHQPVIIAVLAVTGIISLTG